MTDVNVNMTEVEKYIQQTLDLFKSDTKVVLLKVALKLFIKGFTAKETNAIIGEMVCAIRNEYGE